MGGCCLDLSFFCCRLDSGGGAEPEAEALTGSLWRLYYYYHLPRVPNVKGERKMALHIRSKVPTVNLRVQEFPAFHGRANVCLGH